MCVCVCGCCGGGVGGTGFGGLPFAGGVSRVADGTSDVTI